MYLSIWLSTDLPTSFSISCACQIVCTRGVLLGAVLDYTTLGCQWCSVVTSGACFAKYGKVSSPAWATPFSQTGKEGKNCLLPLPTLKSALLLQRIFLCFSSVAMSRCAELCYQQQNPKRDPSRCERLWAVSALSLVHAKGWKSRRLLEHVSAPRSAGVSAFQLLSLLGAMLQLGSSAVCGSQLQANAPEQRGEEGLHHSSRERWALGACEQHQLRSAAASPKLPLAFLKPAPRLFSWLLRSQKEREVREVQTYRNPLALGALAAFGCAIREQLLVWKHTDLSIVAGYAQNSFMLLLGNLSGNNWGRQ